MSRPQQICSADVPIDAHECEIVRYFFALSGGCDLGRGEAPVAQSVPRCRRILRYAGARQSNSCSLLLLNDCVEWI